MKHSRYVFIILFLVLLIDQGLKIWIKTNMTLGQEFYIFGMSWAKLHFTENPGMAFGMELGGDYGKLALSIFRILAVSVMGYYLATLVKSKAHIGLISSLTLILAGAIGNILDSAFYGLIFTQSSIHTAAEWVSFGEGYASFLHGRVVDMLYFPMFDNILPDWVPFWGGERFVFFRPVFNIADSSISVGVFFIILFQKTFFNVLENDTKDIDSEGIDSEEKTPIIDNVEDVNLIEDLDKYDNEHTT